MVKLDAVRPVEQVAGLFPYPDPLIKAAKGDEPRHQGAFARHDLRRQDAQRPGAHQAGEPPARQFGEGVKAVLIAPASEPVAETVQGLDVEFGQRRQQADQFTVKLDPPFLGESKRLAGTPLGDPRQRRRLAGVESGPQAVKEPGDVLLRQGLKRQMTAARADGGKQPARRVAHQQKHRAPGRFLQRLENGIGGVAVHVLGAVDDDHPPAALGRRQAQEGADATDIADDDLAARLLAFLIIAPRQGLEVAMAAGGDPLEHRMFGRDVKARGRACEQVPLGGPGKHETGEAISQGRLADAAHPRYQPRVVQPVGAIGPEQRTLGLAVADEFGIGVRWWRRYGFGVVHRKLTPRRSPTVARIFASTSSMAPSALMTAHLSGSRRAMSRNPSRRRRWKASSMRS